MGRLGVVTPSSRKTTDQLLESDRREPDPSLFASGVSSDSEHASLRSSVRQLSTLLGEALARHEGEELLAVAVDGRGFEIDRVK